MELGGTEKRIQALFSELSLEDRNRVPRFEQLWTRAETTISAPLFGRSLAVMAAAVVMVAASSLVLWSRQSYSALNIAPLQIPTSSLPEVNQLAVTTEQPRTQRQKRIVRRRQIESSAISEAALLSQWQSPTQSFMESRSVPVFNSLPQLDQSAKELESFLPKNNELLKESNQ